MLGLEFVHYRRVSTDLGALDAERDAMSVQAERNGIADRKPREGIVLRPIIEVRRNDGSRIVAKHKAEAFQERQHQPKVKMGDPEVLREAQAIADEWVTPMRLTHVLDKLPGEVGIERTGEVIQAMVADVLAESGGEIVDSKPARSAMSRKAATLFKDRLKAQLRGEDA